MKPPAGVLRRISQSGPGCYSVRVALYACVTRLGKGTAVRRGNRETSPIGLEVHTRWSIGWRAPVEVSISAALLTGAVSGRTS